MRRGCPVYLWCTLTRPADGPELETIGPPSSVVWTYVENGCEEETAVRVKQSDRQTTPGVGGARCEQHCLLWCLRCYSRVYASTRFHLWEGGCSIVCLCDCNWLTRALSSLTRAPAPVGFVYSQTERARQGSPMKKGNLPRGSRLVQGSRLGCTGLL